VANSVTKEAFVRSPRTETKIQNDQKPASPRGFLRGRRGSVLAWTAFMVVPLLGFIGLGTDAARGYMVRARMSQALDAAALAAGRAGADQTKATTMAQTLFTANYPTGYMDSTLTGPTIAFDAAAQTVTVSASAVLPTYFVHLIGVNNFTVSASSQVTSAAVNLEISMILDVTGSMNGTKISDLVTAAKNAVDILIWDDQSQYYSKVAMVPWSNGVNVGTYAAQIRGPVTAAKTITSATKANPVVITSANHGFNNGDKIFISGAKGMTQINNNTANAETATTSPLVWVVTNKTANTFQLYRTDGTKANGSSWGTYTNSGTISCTNPGCQYQYFTPASGSTKKVFTISTCVTERVGAEKYTDAAPSTSYVGRQYPASTNACLPQTIIPMTNDKAALKAAIDTLAANGSTAGQVGTAWAWYMISPNFAYLWPAASQPTPYGADQVLKIAIIMTDGTYNSPYCNGIIAKDAVSGSGNASDHINCNATNGDSYTQSRAVCDAMKAKGIIIYTVGFQLDADPNAQAIMSYCASDGAHAYLASDGAALDAAFRAIAVNIRRLRISK
jgi:Flp pilus assembly protein TadG